ncbi:MAG: class I SAM-dependent methyltransferase, partial [Candidatus Omnitrophica bacterium]|nr:class I SAM-dependent methyltransferase [Candidatus Omnitrophota bacterium]
LYKKTSSLKKISKIMLTKQEILSFYKNAIKWHYRSKIERWENLAPIFNFLKLQPNDKLLDIGCGSGVFVQKARKLCQAFGVDLYPTQNLPYIFRADAEKLPFKNNSFSIVYLSKSFLLMRRKRVLEEVKRVLKSKGRLFIRELLYSPLWDKTISKVKSKLLKQKVSIIRKDPEIKKMITQVLKRNGFKIKKVLKFQTRLTYPSQKILIERFFYYSPLIKFRKHIHTKIIKQTIKQIVRQIYKKKRTTYYNNILIEAIKN